MSMTFNMIQKLNCFLIDENAVLIVAIPIGATITISKNGIVRTPTCWMYYTEDMEYAIFTVQKPAFNNIPWTVNISASSFNFTTTIVINSTKKYDLTFFHPVPGFTYTGEYIIYDDNGRIIPSEEYSSVLDWNIALNSSGVLTFTNLFNITSIDAFLVAGGGGGGRGRGGSGGTGGGGGGGATTIVDYSISANTEYEITVGAGGAQATTSAAGGDGGTTTAFNTSVYGGGNGGINNNNPGGASGGGTGAGGKGGNTSAENGEDGIFAFNTTNYLGGRRFGAGGGGGGTHANRGGKGGLSGGGDGYGAHNYAYSTGRAGTPNTGGGGGGGSSNGSTSGYAGRAGGSGVVIIRNHRS